MLSESPASLGAQPSGGRAVAPAIGPSDEPCQEWVSDGVLLRYDSSPFVWCHLDILRPGHWRQQEPLPFRGNCSCKFRARHSVSCFQIGGLPPQWKSEQGSFRQKNVILHAHRRRQFESKNQIAPVSLTDYTPHRQTKRQLSLQGSS
jgi:hypothetical protein